MKGVKRVWVKDGEEEIEKLNRAHNDYNCKALGEFTSVTLRTVSCQTAALPSGIDKRRGWNKLTPLSFLLSFSSLPAAQRSLCSPACWCVVGLSRGGSQQAGWNRFRSHWWLFHLSLTADNVGKNQCYRVRALQQKCCSFVFYWPRLFKCRMHKVVFFFFYFK